MGKIKIGLIILGLISLIGLVAAGMVMADSQLKIGNPINKKTEFVQDEIIVKLKGDVKPFRVIKVPEGKVREKVKEYLKRADVEYAEPNYIAYTQMVPNDPYYKYQWHLDNLEYGGIQMEKAWDISIRGNSVIVAVIDTGIRIGTDLAKTCFVSGYDFVNNDSDPIDDNGHGTHVAGTIAQSTDNALGVAGVAFNSCLMPVKVLDSRGAGTYANVASGIRFAADNGAKVINLSLGGTADSEILKDAIAYAYNKGVTVVVACGNDNNASCLYPAAYDDYVIAVGATQYDETKAPYSNYGSSLDLVAPGGNTSVDQNKDGYVDGVLQQTFTIRGWRITWSYYFYQGTSMAAPHVSGVAALLIANRNAIAPNEVRAALQETTKDLGALGRDDIYGWGLINAYVALNWTAVPNNPPVADDQLVTIDEDTTVVVILTATDPDGDSLIYSIVSGSSNGTLAGTAPNITYMPNLNYNGPDSFTFKTNDGRVDSNIATVSIIVNSVNDAPVANDQSITTIVNTPVDIVLTATDVDGDSPTYSIVDNPLQGNLSGIPPNITYTPNSDYIGSDSFTFKANDGILDSNIATVSIAINPLAEEILCWKGTNQYLYRNNGQTAKFCKCASGIYGFSSYASRFLRATVYQYVDTKNNENWDVTSRAFYLPVYQVKCTDWKTYPTNQDHYFK